MSEPLGPCSKCGGELAEATAVCTKCGADPFGYYDDDRCVDCGSTNGPGKPSGYSGCPTCGACY